MPAEAWQRAQILQWLFFEQYSHEPFIAVARFWHFAGLADEKCEELPAKMEGGYRALEVMEHHLREEPFFVAGHYSIADISLYAYTHVASEGGFELGGFPALRAWLQRVSSQPRHLRITDPSGELIAWP